LGSEEDPSEGYRTRSGRRYRHVSAPQPTDSDGSDDIVFVAEAPETGPSQAPQRGEDSDDSVMCLGTPPEPVPERVVLSDSSDGEAARPGSIAGP
jgi:hypothetical protein